MVFLEIFIFGVGLGILLKGSDIFVESAANIAKLVGISPFVIGLSLVAVGTSLPELTTSISAAFLGSTEIVFGNVVGSNISNIALILALGVLVGKKSVEVKKRIFESDLFFMFLVSILLFYFSFDKMISFTEGIIFVILFVFYISYLFKLKIEFEKVFHFPSFLKRFYHVSSFLFNLKLYQVIVRQGLNPKTYIALLKKEGEFEEEFVGRIKKGDRNMVLQEYRQEIFEKIVKNFYLFFIGVIAVWLGSELTIKGTIGISEVFNVSQGIIGLTLLAVGTSLPELSVSIISARKEYTSIFLGNLIGSNITNVLLVLGISAIITPIAFAAANFTFSLVLLVVVTLSLVVVVYGDWRITKPEAIFLLFLYLVFLYGLISTG